jgi:hypothetical protein
VKKRALRSFARDPKADGEHSNERRGRCDVAEAFLPVDQSDRRDDRRYGHVGEEAAQ